jgi:pimeloyl-ACP methyl ester carboxylesterase
MYGNGPDVIYLHGFCLDFTIWEPVIQQDTGIRSILIDLPGFGKSPVKEVSSIQHLAEHILQCLHSIGIKQCIIIGHSLGAYAGLEMIKKQTLDIIGFGLVHSHPFSDSDEKRIERKRSIEIVGKGKKYLFVKQLITQLFNKQFNIENPDLIEHYLSIARSLDTRTLVSYMLAMSQKLDNSRILEEYPFPVLCVGGKFDPLIPVSLFYKQSVLASTTFTYLLEHCTHMSMFEDSNLLKKIFRTYIEYCLT